MRGISVECRAICLHAVRRRERGGEVLLLRRTRAPRGEWCQVSGAIEVGETAWQAALRELEEETALAPTALYSGDACEQFYEADRDAISLLPVFVAFVDPSAEVRLNDEHSDFRWVDFKTARDMVSFAGQRHVLRHVEDEFLGASPATISG